MATNAYTTIEAAQAAYDQLVNLKKRAQRDAQIQAARDLKRTENYLKQSGGNGGLNESTLIRARNNLGTNLNSIGMGYDPDIADLAAQIAYLKKRRNSTGTVAVAAGSAAATTATGQEAENPTEQKAPASGRTAVRAPAAKAKLERVGIW